MINKPEILAPAGNMDSLIAAVRTGANAVYLGGSALSARQSANSFDKALLEEAVSYCHARGVKVFQTINTLAFNYELDTVVELIKDAASACVDAFIVQDLGVAELAKKIAPEIQVHGSTQMSIHNLAGVNKLAEMGFSRVVLARELSYNELEYIVKNSPIEIEIFVHGALCMSMSGGCYISSMIGGRSGNRGACAQTCRLPFASGKSTNALSLKDLSLIEYIPELADLGVASFKIEGRLKRPEYVAAVVTACNDVLNDRTPDYETLKGVFSRSGFTQGYLNGELGDEMFGTRTAEDKTATGATLKSLANLYKDENPLIAIDFELSIKSGEAVELRAMSGGSIATITGEEPQQALKTPTDYDNAFRLLNRTGGTPFYLRKLDTNIDEGLIVPASQLNKLRRDAIDQILEKLSEIKPKHTTDYVLPEFKKSENTFTVFRARLETKEQFYGRILEDVDQVILPIKEGIKLNKDHNSIILELPYYNFSQKGWGELEKQLEKAEGLGFSKVLINGIDKIDLARKYNFEIYGDYRLNTTNVMAQKTLENIGVVDVTMSLEYPVDSKVYSGNLPVGIIAYGQVPVMVFRNKPEGLSGEEGYIVDRKNQKFYVKKQGEYYTMYNSVPIILSDKIQEYDRFDFNTLYFLNEDIRQVKEVINLYKTGGEYSDNFTRGLYKRKVK